MRGLQIILSIFRNQFNKFNNTKARMLDSIHHMTLKYLKMHFWWENVKIFPQRYNGRHYVSRKSVNHQRFIVFIAWR